MNRFARIEKGSVVETLDADTLPAFHPSLVWVLSEADTKEGDIYVAGRFSRPPTVSPAIPQSVTPAQGLMALYVLHGITEADIHAAINSIEDAAMRYQATIAFTRATVWERVSVSMGAVAQLMALTEADLDAAFTLAATYTNL